jgi:ethanolamine utilization protein EutQ (cupin superfamily)
MTLINGRESAVPGVQRNEPLEMLDPGQPRLRARWIVAPRPEGHDYALSEWELTRAGFRDRHPHDEVTFVLEGELHIKVEDAVVVGRPGDTITVPAGSAGSYWAPRYARMLGVYGPHQGGDPTEYLGYWEIDEED